MTALVHFFTSQGLETAPVSGNVLTYDSVQYLKEPLLGRDLLSCDSSTADQSEASAAPVNTGIAYVQIQPGKTVFYEITPANEATLIPAAATSRYASGNLTLKFAPGWRLSVLEKTS